MLVRFILQFHFVLWSFDLIWLVWATLIVISIKCLKISIPYLWLFLICCHLSIVSYCMHVRTHVPEIWRCGHCAFDEAKSPDDSGLQFQPRMIRHAKTSKVKFIPTDEVIKLSSGGVKGSSKLNVGFAPQRTSASRKVLPSSLPRPLFQASKESQGSFLSFLRIVTLCTCSYFFSNLVFGLRSSQIDIGCRFYVILLCMVQQFQII